MRVSGSCSNSIPPESQGVRKPKNYGELKKLGNIASGGRIGRIMSEHGLHSAYTISQHKTPKTETNVTVIPNILNRQFHGRREHDAVVGDLTYIRVNYKWNYTYLLRDLFNREIISYSAGPVKIPIW